MKIKLITIGKTTQHFVEDGLNVYTKRITKYYNFNIEEVNNSKIRSTKATDVKLQEAKLLQPYFKPNQFNILLDETGKKMTSLELANQFQKWLNASPGCIAFFIGGAFGFDASIYNKAEFKLSLSAMTFSHQLIRLIFLEQLYRIVSIIHRLPYHNA